jgi:acyl-CoA reductase-like NAD-dependent aldehyde dehydrogenase
MFIVDYHRGHRLSKLSNEKIWLKEDNYFVASLIWQLPFLLSFLALSIDPVIGALAAGNAIVLKPSEMAPATSAYLAKYLPEYVDNSCIKVVEGAISETAALLEQKWDKIFYTGFSFFHTIFLLCILPDSI